MTHRQQRIAGRHTAPGLGRGGFQGIRTWNDIVHAKATVGAGSGRGNGGTQRVLEKDGAVVQGGLSIVTVTNQTGHATQRRTGGTTFPTNRGQDSANRWLQPTVGELTYCLSASATGG